MDEAVSEKMDLEAIGNKDTRARGARNRDQDAGQNKIAGVVVQS